MISFLVEAYDLATNAAPPLVTPTFFGLAVFFLARLAYIYRKDFEILKAERAAKFEIVFEPRLQDGVTDNRPFVQVFDVNVMKTYPDGTPTGKRNKHTDRRFRVGLRSLCESVVPSVELVLVSCDPRSNDIHPGHRFCVIETQAPSHDLTPNQSGEPTLFFDVVSEFGLKGTVPNRFTFCMANASLQHPIAIDRCQIRLRAQGGGYSHERSFVIRKRWIAQEERFEPLTMEPL